MSATISETIDELRQKLTDYIEATYHVGHPAMVEQRRRILGESGGIFQIPYLESTPRYVPGPTYEEMTELPPAAREAFLRLCDSKPGKPIIFNPPYTHQASAIREILVNRKNLMIMTGTGSGKTEAFLLPILGKLAVEARERPQTFAAHTAMRAIVLYPMNALVNDQLGRLRLLFGNELVVAMFQEWTGRPARFARYTSRTPYAGVRSPNKDSSRLASIGDFFVAIEEAANRHNQGVPLIAAEDEKAAALMSRLQLRGKWPSKHSVSRWFGAPHTQWRDRAGNFQRAVVRPDDAELLTRHEVHATPPDVLITNYSMLEYMMMRPIERPIFDQTREWLAACPDETILVVLDEAHLYRGAQGAEVGLLLRRLRERLGVGPQRFQVICATASFSERGRTLAGDFGAQLTGATSGSFVPISGELDRRSPERKGSSADVQILSAIDLPSFYSQDVRGAADSIRPFAEHRNVAPSPDIGVTLFEALRTYPPFNLLVNETMKSAIPLAELGERVFDGGTEEARSRAITTLLAFGSRARLNPGDASLLPCRVHSFFRGLPGLWVCMDPNCSQLAENERGGPAGKLYAQPLERCACGAPVLEYFTCRHCGTSYARAYTNDVEHPRFLWALPGEVLQTDAGRIEAFHPLDLLLEEPNRPSWGQPAFYDLAAGMLNAGTESERRRIVYLQPDSQDLSDTKPKDRGAKPGEFAPCGRCGKSFIFGQTSVQDHLTKGDQPFQALLGTQIRVQPPGPQPATEFAPLRGRKVLVFSDSRQVAARLAPTLQSYSLRDSIRALLPVGYSLLGVDPQFGPSLVLDHAFLAIVVAAHKHGIRLRPELDSGETMPHIDSVPPGQVPSGFELIRLVGAVPPLNITRAIVAALNDQSLGLESLAVASVAESPRFTQKIVSLPNLPGLAELPGDKLAVARAWVRAWQRQAGLWLGGMPPSWWATEVRSHKGGFEAMERVLNGKDARKTFNTIWLPRLLADLTQPSDDGGRRLAATNLSLQIGGAWRRCRTCKSIHRPISQLHSCIDCQSPDVEDFDADNDSVFRARRGFYRDPIMTALKDDQTDFVSIIAAEHTAQLNAAQPDAAFSAAENHELRFQDIDVAWRDTDPREPAIDVLSSTTTMEVGIDIGELSGVALRNMPPGRANYQQRAGRAGRRGNAVATVVAFGSSDSHDDHYFSRPDEMIRGPVNDPRLTLENRDIARRHVRAYLLQRYHEARIQSLDPEADPNLFSVLGYVRDFRLGTGALNRTDFAAWLEENREDLTTAVARWLPDQLSQEDRRILLEQMILDVREAVDAAIDFTSNAGETDNEPTGQVLEPPADDLSDRDRTLIDVAAEEGSELVDPSSDKLLDRLLYRGILPRYAFPTDVASFYVFNRALSTAFRPRMEFAPSQGLNIALSQYAPNKQVWIKGKQYTSKAIYSPYRNDRGDAWGRRRLYFECTHCGHAKTEDYVDANRGQTVECEACRHHTFGPSKSWFRPPGFAHPIDQEPVSVPDAPNETAYATRAKLVMPTPGPDDADWIRVGTRVKGFPARRNLLVSNSGPSGDGYYYCVSCGRIESVADPAINLYQPHDRPYRTDQPEPCPGNRVSPRVVLGTDFITDIALFSLPLNAPFRVRPGNDETAMALRTACEALGTAACRLLQIENGEVLAEHRPALTLAGAQGLEAEIFIYDILAGGAGFAPQLIERGVELFQSALAILGQCPARCDSSCYRCLRSFRNKLDHRLLDRMLGEQTLSIVNEDDGPTLPGHMVIEAAPFGAFVPNVPVARVAVGSLDPGERREITATLPWARLQTLSQLPPISQALREGLEALVDVMNHTHWIGNLNVYFDRRPDQCVERHCAIGLRVPANHFVGAMFVAYQECSYSVTTSDEAWTAEVFQTGSSMALLKVRTPAAPGATARITAYAVRKADGQTVPVEFEFETVSGWGEAVGCVKVG